MMRVLRWWRITAAVFAVAFAFSMLPNTALAGTTGNITGTVTDGATGKPLADVKVSASAPTQSATTTTDAKGFYSLLDLNPDTYTVSFQKAGYTATSVPGVTVFQDQTNTVNQTLRVELKTIASVRSSGAASLVKSNQGSDVYNVSGQELTAATNPTDTHETLYQYLAITPGVSANGFPAQPRIRGGQVTDLGYEFEGIPIQDDIVGFFTTNLANIGINNIEVYTGGLSGTGSFNGTGYFNSVLKSGTYPGFGMVSASVTSPEFNNYLTVERGWATANNKFSGYIGLDAVNSQNQYGYGQNTYPDVQLYGYNGPGPVTTRDWVGNFHYRPDPNDDIQLVATNSLGEFVFNYLAVKAPGEPPILGFTPCPGAVANPNMFTNASGGTAPNGQTCPEGLYWGALSPKTGGNIYHHYGGLGKIQWNHNLNDHSFFALRLDENFNQYIFDQPMAELNQPSIENDPNYSYWGSACPAYPYAAGSPVQMPVFKGTPDTGDICAFNDGINDFWGDRRSNIWGLALDYQNAINSNVTIKAGALDQRNNDIFNYLLTNGFTILPDNSLVYPQLYEIANYPTSTQEYYAEGDLRFGKLLVDPGVAYGQRHYAYPADQGYAGTTANGQTAVITQGGATQRIVNPTFNGTYTFDPNNVVRFSYGNTSNFVATAYVYLSSLGLLHRNPFLPGASFQPQINHSADLMWEHRFRDGTTMRVGPYYNKTTNYYNSYRPFLGYYTSGCNPQTSSGCTPCPQGTTGCQPVFQKTAILSNNNRHQTMGVEFGLNHVNTMPVGLSYYLSATYDNFWTSAADISGAFINSPLPDNITSSGLLIRSASNPLWTSTLLADFHSHFFHVDPLVYYQGDTFFNTGRTCSSSTVAPYICQNEQIAHGWWRADLLVYTGLGQKGNLTVGFKVNNLLNQVTDTAPCKSDGSGCFPFDGSLSGVTAPSGSLIYQNYSQGPRTFQFYLGVKM